MMRTIILFFFVMLIGSLCPATAQTQAWLERAEVTLGDWVVLHIETDQLQATLDETPLRQQFDIGGKSVSRSMQWVNGKSTQTQHLSVGLRPRSEGAQRIPPLRMGQVMTQPLQLIVLPPHVQAPAASADVFIKTDVDTQQPYVQQTLRVKVRIYSATRLISGQLDVDAPQDAALQQLQDDTQTVEQWAGRQWYVVERRFLLIPEKNGTLTLAGPRFHGMREGSDMYSLFGLQAQKIAIAGDAIQFQVQPIPASAPQPWLPLQALSLRYLHVPQQLFAGEAAEVEVELSARGASAVQLPSLLMPAHAGLQVFPEAPQLHDTDDDQQQASVRRKFTVLATQAGRMQLPEISIPWWDASQGVARVAVLPAHTIDVAPGRRRAAEKGQGPIQPAEQKPSDTASQDGVQILAPHEKSDQGVVWLLAGGLLLVVLFFVLHRLLGKRLSAATSKNGEGEAKAKPASLQQALAAGDFGAIATAISLELGLPDTDMGRALAMLADHEQQAALQQMQAARWGTGDAAQALQRLREAFSCGVTVRAAEEKIIRPLAPLYPD